MLREISNIKKEARNQSRRWFTDNDMDLYIWFSEQIPIGFQLSYNKKYTEKALSWSYKSGFSHHIVDSGENRSLRYKMTPFTYLSNDNFDAYTTARNFLRNCDSVEASLSDFIYARLLEYPGRDRKQTSQDVALNSY